MDGFIGREKELALLEKEYRKGSSLILVRGRRRIGKTRMIKEFIKDKESVYFLATNTVESELMQDLWDCIRPERTGGRAAGWKDVFSQLADGRRKVLVIDEFSYMAGMTGDFLIRFQGIYDGILKDSGVMTILCGSHMSLMRYLSEDESSPLYGRFDRRFVLWPLRFSEIPGSGDVRADIERFSVHGGIPRYMELMDGGDLREDVRCNIMEPTSMMFSDPLVVLNSDTGESGIYLSLIRAVANGNHRSSDIASALEMPSSKLSPYLAKLIDTGMLRKDYPVTENNEATSKKGLYMLTDCFTAFWYRFVYPFRSQLMRDNFSFALSYFDREFIEGHAAFVFEEICRQHIIANPEIIGFLPERIGRYWNNNTEIDVAAIDPTSQRAFLGECKYKSDSRVGRHILNELRKKAARIPELKDYEMTFGLFSVTGFDKDVKGQDVILFDLRDILDNQSR